MDIDDSGAFRLVKVMCAFGEMMLKSGAEVYRVENTICRTCTAYGLASVMCSVTPTSITVSFPTRTAPRTHMIRIGGDALDLYKVQLINELSRSLEKEPIPIEELEARYREIKRAKTYPHWVIALAAGAGTGAFAMVFGGGWLDLVSGFIVGVALRFLVTTLSKSGFQEIFTRFVGGAIASLLAGILVYLGLGSQWNLITSAALTLLFPGLLFTNSLRDLTSGDFLSAVTHAVQAFSIAAALAGGAAVARGIISGLEVIA